MARRMDFEIYLVPALVMGKPYGPEELLELEDAAGIERAIIMPPPEVRPQNEWLVETIAGHTRLIGCACINPKLGLEATGEMERVTSEWHLPAIKLQPTFHGYFIHDKIVHPVMEKAAEAGLLVLIHSGTYGCYPLEIGLLAEAFPQVPIIMDHMGHRFRVGEAIEVARRQENVYLGTTVVNGEPFFIYRAVKEVGAERLIFGSNAPGTWPDLCVESIKRIGLTREEEDLILGENLARLLDERQK